MESREQYEEFEHYVTRLATDISYTTFTYTPESVVEELVTELRALHCELARIAYTDNWPKVETNDRDERNNYLRQWMQAVAANALTNIGRPKVNIPLEKKMADDQGMDDERTNW